MKEASKCRRKKLIISHLRNQKLSIWPKSHDLDLTMWWFGHVPFLTLFKCKLPKYYTDQQCVWCFLKNIWYSQFWLLGRPDFFCPHCFSDIPHAESGYWVVCIYLTAIANYRHFAHWLTLSSFLKWPLVAQRENPLNIEQVQIELVLIPCVGVPEKCR